MLMWPSSTAPARPASESVRSVSAPTIRTVSVPSNRSAIARIRASLGVPVEQHRVEDELLELVERHPGLLGRRGRRVFGDHPRHRHRHRPLAQRRRHLLRGRLPLVREIGPFVRVLRRPDRDQGVDLAPDPLLQRRRPPQDLDAAPPGRTGRRSARTTSCRIGYAPRRATCSITASTSGRASGVERITTCHPGCTPTDRSTSSRAYSSTRGSRTSLIGSRRPQK